MIYQETYQYLLRNVSAKEFDICLYSLLKLDWDGIVRADAAEIAIKTGTTKKYVKEVIKKFTSPIKGRFVFVKEEGYKGVQYRFNVGKSSLLYNPLTDKYSKKYKFFYSSDFKKLPINAKRLILMGAFRMSVLKSEEVSMNFEEILPTAYKDNNLPFTRKRLAESISIINQSELKNIVKVSIASNIYTRKEIVFFSFSPNTLEEFYENNTERELLRKKLYEAGFTQFFSDKNCIEVEKVGKYLYNSFLTREKETAKKKGTLINAKDALMKLARYVYDAAIDRLASSLASKKEELDEPKKVSAYFSAICYHIVTEEMAKNAHQASSIGSLLDMHFLHRTVSEQINSDLGIEFDMQKELEPIRRKKFFHEYMFFTLKNWCEDWMISRIKHVADDVEESLKTKAAFKAVREKRGWKDKKEILNHIDTIKKTAYQQLEEIRGKVVSFSNKAVGKEESMEFITQVKESIGSYFAIHQFRLEKNLSNSIFW